MHGVKGILRLIALTTFSFIWPVSAGFCGVVDEAQTLLNRLGYNAGVADGIYGQKTHRALENFYSDLGFKYDGILSEAELSDLENVVSGKGISSHAGDTESYVPMELETKHIVPNKLREIKVVPNWQPVKNYDLLKSEESFQITRDNGIVLSMIKREFGEERCVRNLKNTTYENAETGDAARADGDMWYSRCTAWAITQAKMGKKKIMQDILLAWTMNDVNLLGSGGPNNWTGKGYQVPSTFGVFSQYYGLHYHSFTFKDDERSKVDAYLKKEFMKWSGRDIGYYGGRHKCLVDVPEHQMVNSWLRNKVAHNNCGSIRYKVAAGEIFLGFAIGDQELLDKGHDDIYVVFAQYDKDGIGMAHAMKSARVVNYSIEYAAYLSIFAELYKSVGYDFLEHTLPHGAKVYESLTQTYQLIQDHTHYEKYLLNNENWTFPKYSTIANMTTAEFRKTEHAHNAYDYANGDMQFVKKHMEFVDRYMPRIDKKDIEIMMYLNLRKHPGANYGVSADIMYFANK